MVRMVDFGIEQWIINISLKVISSHRNNNAINKNKVRHYQEHTQ